jgi:hypothetical protein
LASDFYISSANRDNFIAVIQFAPLVPQVAKTRVLNSAPVSVRVNPAIQHALFGNLERRSQFAVGYLQLGSATAARQA